MQELWRAPVRRRLVRLCAVISGDPAAAEDLAQETLLEAWRNAHKLHDPSGAERWLAAIARNVCLRNARRRGREPLVAATSERGRRQGRRSRPSSSARSCSSCSTGRSRSPAGDAGCARPAVRPRRAARRDRGAARRLGGRGVDAARRGKTVLRRLLAAELGREADGRAGTRRACGAASADGGSSRCGPRDAHDAVTFSCPGLLAGRAGLRLPARRTRSSPTLVGGLVRPTAILARTGDWLQRYFGGGAGASGTRARAAARRRAGASGTAARRAGTPTGCSSPATVRRAGLVVGRGSRARARRGAALPARRTRATRLLPRRDSTSAARRAFAVRVEDVVGRSARRRGVRARDVTRARSRRLERARTCSRLLLRRDFALLWTGGLVSIAGDWVLNAALPFFVYERTGSTIATAGMIVAELAPGVVIGSVAGVFVDRWDRKHVLVVANVLQAATVGALLLVTRPELAVGRLRGRGGAVGDRLILRAGGGRAAAHARRRRGPRPGERAERAEQPPRPARRRAARRPAAGRRRPARRRRRRLRVVPAGGGARRADPRRRAASPSRAHATSRSPLRRAPRSCTSGRTACG